MNLQIVVSSSTRPGRRSPWREATGVVSFPVGSKTEGFSTSNLMKGMYNNFSPYCILYDAKSNALNETPDYIYQDL